MMQQSIKAPAKKKIAIFKGVARKEHVYDAATHRIACGALLHFCYVKTSIEPC